MKLQTTKTLAIVSMAISGLLMLVSILFIIFAVSQALTIGTLTPEELEANPFPYIRFLLLGVLVYTILITLLATSYQVIYTFVVVEAAQFEKKTTMILLIIGYFVWVVALVGLIMTLTQKEKNESK
ncbi:MAG TPA: hypothetical protein GXZ51_01005 [Acholeplasma sp.]|nr:hypothetical protein [Acholeplasma sp.]